MDARQQIDAFKQRLNIKTDEELAETLGVSQPAVSAWVKRSKIPDRIYYMVTEFAKEYNKGDEESLLRKITDSDTEVEVLQTRIRQLEAEIAAKNKELDAANTTAEAYARLISQNLGGQAPGKSIPSPKTLGDGQIAGTNVAA
jgi:predicted transcriptional regulator